MLWNLGPSLKFSVCSAERNITRDTIALQPLTYFTFPMATLSAASIRSDHLASLRPLIQQSSFFKSLEGIFQLTVIIDANIILGDLLWLTKKRSKPGARSELKELLDAGTIIAIAPTFLEEEIHLHVQRLAKERAIPIEALRSEWDTYRSLITFIDVGGPDDAFEDPKDAPYLKLQQESGNLIYSRDSDIPRMGGRVAPPALFANLRVYSRQIVVEYALKAGGQGTLVISFAMITAIVRLAKTLTPHAKKLPRYVLWTAFILIVCALLHSPTRQFLKNFLQPLPDKTRKLTSWLVDEFSALLVEHEAARRAAAAALTIAKGSVAETKGRP